MSLWQVCARRNASLVGVTGRRHTADGISVPVVRDAAVETFFVDYVRAVVRAGGLPVALSMECDPVLLISRLDAVVLSGGADVDPRRYGSPPGPNASPIEPLRDEFETALVDAAWDEQLPVLGICRGAQLINVARGGSLVEHLAPDEGEAHSFLGYPRDYRAHAVNLTEGSLLHALYGDRIEVNSLHHQAVAGVGAGLRISGTAPDGVTEAIEAIDAPVVGVQWHPEMFGDTDPLFSWLVESAVTRRNGVPSRKREDNVVA